MINCKIDVLKIPKDKLFKGEKGTYLNFSVARRKEVGQYGDTHTVYLYDKDTKEKTYIGEGKEIVFEDSPRKSQIANQDTGINGLSGNDGLPF